MKLEDRKVVLKYFNELLNRYGEDRRAVAMGTVERHRLRHQILTEVGLREGHSVLDLGCGLGTFYEYLQERELNCSYTGYDINPNMVELARKKHPGVEFQVKDIQEESFPEFDFIVSSNAFSLRLEEQGNYKVAEDILKRCYERARCGVAIDFPSLYADHRLPEAFHYNPERIFSIAKKITKRVCLRHDYPLFEFCIYLYTDFQGWSAKPNP